MKFILWLFSITKRHHREILKYKEGGYFGRFVALLIGFLWVAILFLCEYGFLKLIYDFTMNLVAQIFSVILLGAFSFTLLIMVIEYFICFTFIAFKMAFLEKVLNTNNQKNSEEPEYNIERKIRNLRITDILLGFIFLASAIAVTIFFFMFLLNYNNFFNNG